MMRISRPRQWQQYAAAAAMLFLFPAFALGAPPQTNKAAAGAEIHVGIDDGDIRGGDNRALQAAVDYVAKMGGGTVRIGPGHYKMRNALVLRDNVRVCGVPGNTVLVTSNAVKSRLAVDGDCNERQITLEDPSGFQVGDGVVIRDDRYAGGFEVTTATLTARVDARSFRISAPLYLDYMVSRKATACLAFPVVGGWGAQNAAVERLTIDGNRAGAEYLDGCRGGGIYLFDCEHISVRNCTVRHYNGDGISFQVSQHITVEDCLCENNAGLGLHPGSGSQHPVVCRNRSFKNGDDGLFVCWRVKHGLFEDNKIQGNRGAGVSIGHKDTDNLFRGNTIIGNGKADVLFREESEPMGAHRNIFEGNQILDNSLASGSQGAGACIVIRGHHHELVFRKNTIGFSKPTAASVGILPDKNSKGLQTVDNQFLHLETAIKQEGR